MADDFEQGGSKLYASLARSLADEPVVEAIVGDHEPRWEAPLRLFGGVHYLELSGMVQHPWAKLRGVLEANRDWLARFVAEQPRGAGSFGTGTVSYTHLTLPTIYSV